MKKICTTATMLLITVMSFVRLYAQDCDCPPIKIYVYDTKLGFNNDDYKQTSADAGAYAFAQNSGDWLEGAYLKQQSDEFKVYKGIKPGADMGTTLEPAPENGGQPGHDIDFTSYAEVNRTGDRGHYTYSITLKIFDAYTDALAASAIQTTTDLGKVDDVIEACVGTMSPVLDKLRDYQKQIRDQSGNTKWIYLKFKVIPEREFIKRGDKMQVAIKIFDCADNKPAANQKVAVKLMDPEIGSLNVSTATTNSNGEAIVVFTAKKNGQTELYVDQTFTSVNGESGYHTLNCGDLPKITVKDEKYKITMDAEQTLPMAGQDIKLHGEYTAVLKADPDGSYFLEPIDKTRNMQVKVEQGVFAQTDGSSQTLTAPLSYSFPFLFTIDQVDSTHQRGHGTMNLYYTSPQGGKVIWKIQGNGHTVIETFDIDKGTQTTSPGITVQILKPGNTTSNAIAMSTATQLNLVASYNRMNIGNTLDNVNRNIANSGDMMAFAKRMQAHENDPNYFKTKQGKADLQKMMTLQKQVGGNIGNSDIYTEGVRQRMIKKMETNPDYVGSKEQQSDLKREHVLNLVNELSNGHKAPLAKVTPGAALLRIEGNFNTKSSQAFNQEIKGASLGGGQQQIVFKIKVVKIQ